MTVHLGDYDSYLYRKQSHTEKPPGAPPPAMEAADETQLAPTPPRNGRYASQEERQRRSLSNQARKLARQIEKINASLAEREARIAEMEAAFSSPDPFEQADRIAARAEQYQALKDETGSLWGEWERLSLEAEAVDVKLSALKTS